MNSASIEARNTYVRAVSLVILIAAALTITMIPAGAQTQSSGRRIEGTVLDAQGLPIVGAQVTLVQPQGNLSRTLTSSAEPFRFENLAAGTYTLRVVATGFQQQQMQVDLNADPTRSVEIKLQPAGITEETVVTATRSEQRVSNVPASVNVISSEEIQRSPAVVADDVLRQVPTFSLFRRTSSLASHPTAQGVSLRGIGPSGVSRTLVLLDDIPFNDPFGGWVYWTRVPLMDTDRIEIVDGATSSLYGNYAMGGVINIVTNRAQRRTLIFKPQYGNLGTPKMDLFASDVWGRLGASLNATTFNTDGYKIVAEQERGPIDNEAWVKYNTGSGKLDYQANDRINVFFRGGVFDEKRSNGKTGTVPETNKTNWKFGAGGVGVNMPDGGHIDGRLFFDHSHFYSTFLAVPTATPPRSQDNLTLEQNVPTNAVGSMIQWTRGFQFGGKSNALSAGTDWRWVKGDSDELTYALPTGLVPQLHRVSGGRQKIGGAFAQDLVELTSKLQLTLSARVDHWSNYDGHNHETTISSGQPTANDKVLADRSDTAVSPRVAALYRATDRVNVWGSFSRGFRAPTLNELYRQFRVGAILTLANENLGPERLTGFEGGFSVAATDNVTVRVTAFNNRVKDPVANVTTNAADTIRQRQNLGSTNIAGLQTDLAYRINRYWSVSAAYLFDNAKVHESVPNAAGVDLTGKYLAEVPKNRGSLQVTFSHPKYVTLSWDTQVVGMQFDDDQNIAKILPNTPDAEVGLPAYSVSNFTASRDVNRDLDVFFGVQNLFGKLYYVGTNPTTIGTPRLVNVGIRLRIGR